MRGSGRRRATLGMVLGAALCGATGGSALATEDGGAIDAIALSTDGTRWSATLTESLFHDLQVVPGDVEAVTLWLRNDHHDASRFAVTVTDPRMSGEPTDPWFKDLTLEVWTPTGPASGATAFAEVLDGAEVASGALAPGEVVPVTLELAFPVTATSGNGTAPFASFDLVVTMGGTTAVVPVVPDDPAPPATPSPAPPASPRVPSGPDLPWTGSDPLGLLLVAGGAILAGTGLAWWSVRRTGSSRL